MNTRAVLKFIPSRGTVFISLLPTDQHVGGSSKQIPRSASYEHSSKTFHQVRREFVMIANASPSTSTLVALCDPHFFTSMVSRFDASSSVQYEDYHFRIQAYVSWLKTAHNCIGLICVCMGGMKYQYIRPTLTTKLTADQGLLLYRSDASVDPSIVAADGRRRQAVDRAALRSLVSLRRI